MRLFNTLLSLAFELTLLTSCALLPEQATRAKLLVMPNVERSLKTNSQAEQIIQAWPQAQWWQAFHNDELNRLMTTALANNPSLHAATARLRQAEALTEFQAAELLPTINASIDLHVRRFSGTDFYGPNGDKTFTGAYIDPLLFRYHLDLWGKDKATLAAAIGKERAQASELAMARLLLSTRIVRSYIRLCTAEEDRLLSHALSDTAEKIAQLSQLRWQQGLSSQDPVYASKQQLALAVQRETTVQSRTQKLRYQIAALAGQGPDWGRQLRPEIHLIPGHLPQPNAVSLGLLTHRPDLAAALWRVEAAARMVKVATTNFYPDVNLVGFAGLRSLNLKDLFLSSGTSVAYGIGPTLTLPIFEGGRLDAELKHEQAAYDAAVENYNDTLLTAVQQVADSLAEWRQTLAHAAAQEQALTAALAAASLSDKRYAAGLSTRDSPLATSAALIEQRLKASELHNNHLLAAVGLIEVLGGGYDDVQVHNIPAAKQR